MMIEITNIIPVVKDHYKEIMISILAGFIIYNTVKANIDVTLDRSTQTDTVPIVLNNEQLNSNITALYGSYMKASIETFNLVDNCFPHIISLQKSIRNNPGLLSLNNLEVTLSQIQAVIIAHGQQGEMLTNIIVS